MTRAPLLAGVGLAAVRGERILFRDVSVSALPGDVIILRGSNGSGKTTLLRQLAGVASPQAGTIERARSHHWIGHRNGLKAHETPRTHLQHWAQVWGSAADASSILQDLQLHRPADVPSRMLSAGQKRRTAIGRLKLVSRDIWLLDEPFNALDTDGQAMLAEMIRSHCAKGGAVIAALHGATAIEASGEVEL